MSALFTGSSPRSMGDMDGPVVAKRVYSELFKGDGESLDPDAIPYGFDAAVRDLRENGVHLSQWGTYVHLGTGESGGDVQNLPKAFLAFLSACDTAMGDEKQPDQAVHLASTMLFAGFSVVSVP